MITVFTKIMAICVTINYMYCSNWLFYFSGKYVCVKCGFDLFSSNAKYEHSSPWPAFSETLRPDSLYKKPETVEVFKVCFTLVLVQSEYRLIEFIENCHFQYHNIVAILKSHLLYRLNYRMIESPVSKIFKLCA